MTANEIEVEAYILAVALGFGGRCRSAQAAIPDRINPHRRLAGEYQGPSHSFGCQTWARTARPNDRV
jgi:hypothetical protein